MKNKLKLTMFIFITNCIMCSSLNAHQNMLYCQLGGEEGGIEQFISDQKKKKEQAQKMKQKKENVQVGLIIGGILAIPLLIVSTTLLISKIKEKES